jgi:hypothetical protein
VVRRNLCGAGHQQQAFNDLKQHLCLTPILSLPDLNNPLILRQMLQTMLWVSFSLSTTTMWPIIVRHYHMLFVSTLLMTKKCTPLCKPIANGDITFLGRRQSSTLIIIHCSSCRHKENCRMTAIKSGPHTCINSTSTSSIKQEAPTASLIASADCQSSTLTVVLDSCGHETFGWPQLYETDPDFATTYQMLGANILSLISIFRWATVFV